MEWEDGLERAKRMPRMGQSQAKEVTASWQCCKNSIARSLSCAVSGGCAPVFVVDMSCGGGGECSSLPGAKRF